MIISDKKWQKYLSAAGVVKDCIDGVKMNKHEKCEQTRNLMAGMFAQLIFNCPDIHTGLISPAGRIQKTGRRLQTADHFRGRTGSALVLYDQAMKGASVIRLAFIIASRCRVHWISNAENIKLRQTASQNPYKTKKEIQEEYSRLNIVLEEFVPIVSRTYDYHIENQIYTSVSQIKAMYNLSFGGVDHRCKSSNYPDWQKVKIA